MSKLFCVECDWCEALVRPIVTVQFARSAASVVEHAGWITVDNQGVRRHMCPACQEAQVAAQA